jgi:hypothetical protein
MAFMCLKGKKVVIRVQKLLEPMAVAIWSWRAKKYLGIEMQGDFDPELLRNYFTCFRISEPLIMASLTANPKYPFLILPNNTENNPR